MIQIGIPEILLLFIVVILFIQPKDMTKFIQDITKFFFKFRANVESIKEEAEQTLNLRELKQDAFNEQKMKSFEDESRNK